MFLKPKYLILVVISSFCLGFAFETIQFNSDALLIKKFNKVFKKKEIAAEKILHTLSKKLKTDTCCNFLYEKQKHFVTINNDAIAVFVYKNNWLVYWSDNTVPVNNFLVTEIISHKPIFLKNAWYYVISKTYQEYVITAYILIKYEYPYKNKFLQNEFYKEYKLPSTINVVNKETSGAIAINNFSGDTVFYLQPSYNGKLTIKSYWAIFFYLVSLTFLVLFLLSVVRIYRTKISEIILSIALLSDLILIRFFMIYYKFPNILYKTNLFSPKYFADSVVFPSLGDLLLNVIFIFIFSLIFYYRFIPKTNLSVLIKKILTVILIIGLGSILLFIHYILQSIITNSTITIDLFNILLINEYSFIGYLIIALLFVILLLWIDKIISLYNWFGIKKWVLPITIFSLLILCKLTFYNQLNILFVLFTLLVISIIIFIRNKNTSNIYSHSNLSLLLFICAVFTVYFVETVTDKKEKNLRKVVATSLALERDPDAELKLQEINNQLCNDSNIANYIYSSEFNIDTLNTYMRQNYFSGYWLTYDIQLTLCDKNDSLIIKPDNIQTHCFSFFNSIINPKGIMIPNTNFYFLDIINGHNDYLGAVPIKSKNKTLYTFFIELRSKRMSSDLGYPELLLNASIHKNSKLSNYSYAKYQNNKLIVEYGTFSYPLNQNWHDNTTESYSYSIVDNYNHLIYKVADNFTIIISSPQKKIIDYIISFSYVFVFYYLLLIVALLLLRLPFNINETTLNLKTQIQTSVIGILAVSLIFICGITIYYNIELFRKNQYDYINEKIQSVLVELEHKIGYEEQLNSQYSNYLNSLLIKFSNVFYTDINLFDCNGDLIGTSRDEIFSKGLIGKKINPEAYKQLAIYNKTLYIHNENIGNLKYLSAYVPFLNKDGNLLAYLNLPYFAKENIFKEELSALLVAIVNIYVLLILIAILLAVLISNRITQPLRMLQQKLRQLGLSKKNEPIIYSRNDEIGNLVNEYNRMIDELARSAELLAKSERDIAWREMAKQIAHEIKNPLTPMKLSIQLLKKSWNEKDPLFEEKFNKVAQTLQEQIDRLATIASDFSKFARMPKSNPEIINIVEYINHIAFLYQQERIEFKIKTNNLLQALIFIDKEQLNQIFNNIISNAIQAIPENKHGIIIIEVTTDDKQVKISISDNGIGIPESLQSHIFEPNFTTKSSGMGLGLAIVKTILDEANSTIHFETQSGKGTTFILHFPNHKQNI